MSIKSFEDIIAWKKAKKLSLDVYRLFGDSKDFGFRDQIQRAAVSIMNNIAEGFERKSNQDFKRFLYIAKGSCGEVRSMLVVAKELEYITEKEYDELRETSVEISKLLSGFIEKL